MKASSDQFNLQHSAGGYCRAAPWRTKCQDDSHVTRGHGGMGPRRGVSHFWPACGPGCARASFRRSWHPCHRRLPQPPPGHPRRTQEYVLVRIFLAARHGHDRQQTVSHCNYPVTLECLRLWPHERTPRFPRNTDDSQSVDSADIIGTIA